MNDMTAGMKMKERAAKRARVELSLRENYALCDFLVKRVGVPGESYADIAAEANKALDSQRINDTHIKSRFEALELKLKPNAGGADERIAELERRVARLSSLLFRTISDPTGSRASVLATLYEEFGAGQ